MIELYVFVYVGINVWLYLRLCVWLSSLVLDEAKKYKIIAKLLYPSVVLAFGHIFVNLLLSQFLQKQCNKWLALCQKRLTNVTLLFIIAMSVPFLICSILNGELSKPIVHFCYIKTYMF